MFFIEYHYIIIIIIIYFTSLFYYFYFYLYFSFIPSSPARLTSSVNKPSRNSVQMTVCQTQADRICV